MSQRYAGLSICSSHCLCWGHKACWSLTSHSTPSREKRYSNSACSVWWGKSTVTSFLPSLVTSSEGLSTEGSSGQKNPAGNMQRIENANSSRTVKWSAKQENSEQSMCACAWDWAEKSIYNLCQPHWNTATYRSSLLVRSPTWAEKSI